MKQSGPKARCGNCEGKGKLDSFDEEFCYPSTNSSSHEDANTKVPRRGDCCEECCDNGHCCDWYLGACWLGTCCCLCQAIPGVKIQCPRCKGTGFVVRAKVQFRTGGFHWNPRIHGFSPEYMEGGYVPHGHRYRSIWVPLGGISAGGEEGICCCERHEIVSKWGSEVYPRWHERWVPRGVPSPSVESMERV